MVCRDGWWQKISGWFVVMIHGKLLLMFNEILLVLRNKKLHSSFGLLFNIGGRWQVSGHLREMVIKKKVVVVGGCR